MALYYTLRSIAYFIGEVRSTLTELGLSIRDVWLIGVYLSTWFIVLSARLSAAEGAVYSLSVDWYEFYIWVLDKIDLSNALDLLVRYADDLISFILDPDYYIVSFLRVRFPSVYNFFFDPVNFIIASLAQYTGLDYDFIFNPITRIQEEIYRITSGIQTFLSDPLGFIVSKLAEVMPDVYEFLYDIRGWIRNRIADAFPFVYDLLNDPHGFIEDNILDALERVKDRYQERLIRLVESVLQAIF